MGPIESHRALSSGLLSPPTPASLAAPLPAALGSRVLHAFAHAIPGTWNALLPTGPRKSSHCRPRITDPLPARLAPGPLMGLERKEEKESQTRRLNFLQAKLGPSAAAGSLCRNEPGVGLPASPGRLFSGSDTTCSPVPPERSLSYRSSGT